MDAVWERIRGNRYDLRAWRQVLQHASQQAIQEARPLYEEVLRAFPTAWWVWRLYAEAELAHARADSSTVEAIFSRCLLRCRFVSLWRVYIRYVFNAFAEGSSSGVRARLEALEFALSHVGLDPSSGELWLQYVSLLRRVDPSFLPDSTDPSGAESARMVKVRRAFHQALSIPQSHIDFLWHEYERFEHSISAKLAKPMLEELRPKMQAARSVLEERQRLFDRLPDAALAGPPSEMRNSEEVSKAWRNYLTLERRNTQRVGEEALVKRVCLAYDQCLCCLTMARALTFHVPPSPNQTALRLRPSCSSAHIPLFSHALNKPCLPLTRSLWPSCVASAVPRNVVRVHHLVRGESAAAGRLQCVRARSRSSSGVPLLATAAC
jgi:cleavage stimulation factor subunit 3